MKKMILVLVMLMVGVSSSVIAQEGLYKSELGEIQIRQQNNNLSFNLSVSVPQLNGFTCTGEVSGVAKKISGSEYMYQSEEDDCNIKLIIVNDDIVVTESGCGVYHGAGCIMERGVGLKVSIK